MLITSTADYTSLLRLSAGDHTGFLAVSPTEFAMKSENKSINIVPANTDGRVNLHGYGGLKAFTDPDGFEVNGHLVATGSVTSGTGNFYSSGTEDLRLYRGGDLHMFCRGDGWTEFTKALRLTGSKGEYFSGQFRFGYNDNNEWVPGSAQEYALSIRAENTIAAHSYIAFSDRRIKKNLHVSFGKSDLATLMQLEVTDYRHIDTLAKGSGEVKGFIAQQVEEVYPQAVSRGVDAIPNIYARPVGIQVNATEATLKMTVEHDLEVGNRVRIMQDGGEQKEYEVVRVEGNAFTVKDWDARFTQAEKVFVYGKEVQDFRTVDYDKIHNLNVSATQELARRVAQLEAENAALRQKTGELDGLRSELNDMKARFSKLESLLISNANR
jgi:hypothetical protein